MDRGLWELLADGEETISMVFAVSATEGLIHHDLMMGSMTRVRFSTVLSIGRVRYNAVPKVIIFDKAPARRGAQEVQCSDNVTLKWQPPYSPFFEHRAELLCSVESCKQA